MAKKEMVNWFVPFSGKFIVSDTVPPIIIKVSISEPSERKKK
jgi:hypothetical protein